MSTVAFFSPDKTPSIGVALQFVQRTDCWIPASHQHAMRMKNIGHEEVTRLA
jgi:hypothetical protein